MPPRRKGGVRLVAAVGDELGSLPGTALGVGLVAAGVAVGRFLAEARPEAVVLVGTAGAYPGGPKIGAVVAASELGLGSVAATLSLGYVPRAPGPLRADPGLNERIRLPTARVLTALAITSSPELARQLGAGWEVEHMEAYAVAWACAEAGIPFAAVLGITNDVGPNAHAEWLRHRVALQRAAQASVSSLL